MTTAPIKITKERWRWSCRLQDDVVWHGAVDDCGEGNTHAEVLAASEAHLRKWHDPENPIRVCGKPTEHGQSCVRTQGHVGDWNGNDNCHGFHQNAAPGELEADEIYTVGKDFDEFGRWLSDD